MKRSARHLTSGRSWPTSGIVDQRGDGSPAIRDRARGTVSTCEAPSSTRITDRDRRHRRLPERLLGRRSWPRRSDLRSPSIA